MGLLVTDPFLKQFQNRKSNPPTLHIATTPKDIPADRGPTLTGVKRQWTSIKGLRLSLYGHKVVNWSPYKYEGSVFQQVAIKLDVSL